MFSNFKNLLINYIIGSFFLYYFCYNFTIIDLNDIILTSLSLPLFTSPNLSNNPHINQIKIKIHNSLSNNLIKQELTNYILIRIERDPTELVKELNLPSILNKEKKVNFTAPLPNGFSSLFAFKDLPGIYLFISKDKLNSYIGSTVNLYIRCKNHYNNSINDTKKHPKLYNYIAKYKWESMEVQILTLNINHEKQFMLNSPAFNLDDEDLNLLFLLTKYELLLTEQYFIDHLNPSLNIDFLVNWGGQVFLFIKRKNFFFL